ncbi:MAG: GGDEF domain-containing protein [Actinomycetota bacterium]|nr:GGDEF domain-containing protein [Actinomycetota bacterium]
MTAATAVCAAVGAIDVITSLLQPEPWPHEPRTWIGAAALGFTLLAGFAATLRLALASLRPLGPAQTEHDVARLLSDVRTDSLTRLANRRAFTDDLAAEIDKRSRTGSVFSLMAIDLDGLKEINDTHGHQAGDEHLTSTARWIERAVDSAGTVYRTGGDEFMVLLPGKRNLDAIELAHKIQEATGASDGRRTLSIGVTETRGTEHRQALVRQADIALYEAKRAKLPVVAYRWDLEGVEAASGRPGPMERTHLTRNMA